MRRLGVVMALRRDDVISGVFELFSENGSPVWHRVNPAYIDAKFLMCHIGPGSLPLQEQVKLGNEQQERYEEVTKEAMASPTGVGIRSYDPRPWGGKEAGFLRQGEGTPERPAAHGRALNEDSSKLAY